MRVTATFSEGMWRQLTGRAIGDEFTVTARARIVGADEALIDVSSWGDTDPPTVMQGELEVRLLLSHPTVTETVQT
jgi:hypothetical protein